MLIRKLKGFVRIFRPELPFAAGACVVVGEVLAQDALPTVVNLFLGFVAGFFLSGSAIVLNDYFDLEVDRVNTPERPLPSGIIIPTEAILLSIGAAFIGLWAAFALGAAAFLLCLFFWLIGCLYNWKFKEAGLLGNLMVSSSVAMTFLLGGIAVGEPWNGIVWTFGLMAFFIDLGEELAGDGMDIEGDRKRNSKSLAILHGKKFALRISSAMFGLVILIGFAPIFWGWLGTAYLIMIATIDLLIVVFIRRLWGSKTPEAGRKAMRGIYLSALLAVIAFVIGKILV